VGKVVAEAAEMYTGGNTNEGNSGTGSTDKDARWAVFWLLLSSPFVTRLAVRL
jgi:hypothetical protein